MSTGCFRGTIPTVDWDRTFEPGGNRTLLENLLVFRGLVVAAEGCRHGIRPDPDHASTAAANRGRLVAPREFWAAMPHPTHAPTSRGGVQLRRGADSAAFSTSTPSEIWPSVWKKSPAPLRPSRSRTNARDAKHFRELLHRLKVAISRSRSASILGSIWWVTWPVSRKPAPRPAIPPAAAQKGKQPRPTPEEQ